MLLKATIFIVALILTLVAYRFLFPWKVHIVTLTQPDHYETNGFDHIDSFVSRLLEPSKDFNSLSIFTPDGKRGFGLSVRDAKTEVTFMVHWRQEPEREESIRAFFRSLSIKPLNDYLAGNGFVRDATRVLSYPVPGDASVVTGLTRQILEELCGVSSTEALDFRYKEKS